MRDLMARAAERTAAALVLAALIVASDHLPILPI